MAKASKIFQVGGCRDSCIAASTTTLSIPATNRRGRGTHEAFTKPSTLDARQKWRAKIPVILLIGKTKTSSTTSLVYISSMYLKCSETAHDSCVRCLTSQDDETQTNLPRINLGPHPNLRSRPIYILAPFEIGNPRPSSGRFASQLHCSRHESSGHFFYDQRSIH